MSKSDPHPLYPEQNDDETQYSICLYEPKECMICSRIVKYYEWKNVTKPSWYMAAKPAVEFLRVCTTCSYQSP